MICDILLFLTVALAANSTFYLNETSDLKDVIEPTIKCIDNLTNNVTVSVVHMNMGGYAFTVSGEKSKFGNTTHLDELQDCIDLYSESGLAYTLDPIDESQMQPLVHQRIGSTELLIQTEHPQSAANQDTDTEDLTSKSESSSAWGRSGPVRSLRLMLFLLQNSYGNSMYDAKGFKCGVCYSYDGKIAGSETLDADDSNVNIYMMVWPHHNCRSASPDGSDSTGGTILNVRRNRTRKLNTRMGSF